MAEGPASPACPDFGAAVLRFRDFLRAEGWPTDLLWVREADLVRLPDPGLAIFLQGDDDGAARAERVFEAARAAGLGVAMEAVCTLGAATCAVIAWPRDPEEAARALYPADGGLKLGAATPRLEGTARWSAC
jgi:hypothetical protein